MYFCTNKILLETSFYWLCDDSQVQDQSGGLGEMYKNVTVDTRKIDVPQHMPCSGDLMATTG